MADAIRRKRKDNFFRVSNDTFAIKLLPTDFVIYCCLCRYADNTTEEAFPGYSKIATDCNITRRRAITGIKNLETIGLVDKKKRSRKGVNISNLYTVNEPQDIHSSELSSPGVVNSDHHSGEHSSLGVVNTVHPEIDLSLKRLFEEERPSYSKDEIKEYFNIVKKAFR